MYGLGPEKSLRLVYETFYLAIVLLFTRSSILDPRFRPAVAVPGAITTNVTIFFPYAP
jgi:hypothetical protein